ncbi:MAG TPA: hypothetical protein VMB50_11805 [Myxococcales bacterium]|nr:hypothetical protein [Myxococcales bacterium]
MPKLLGLFLSVGATAAKRALRGWPVALAVLGYAALMVAATFLFGRLGIVGGFILGFIEAACISSYLHLLSVVVSGSKLTLDDLRAGFFALLWDVIGVLFVLWIASWGIDALVQAAGDHGRFVSAAWGLLVAIFLNPVPELIYLRRAPGRTTDLIVASARFVHEHWIEWFLPNLLFGFALLALVVGVQSLDAPTLMIYLPKLFSLEGAYQLAPSLIQGGSSLWLAPIVLALCHYVMVYRGLLFQEIQGGGWRARALRGAWR